MTPRSASSRPRCIFRDQQSDIKEVRWETTAPTCISATPRSVQAERKKRSRRFGMRPLPQSPRWQARPGTAEMNSETSPRPPSLHPETTYARRAAVTAQVASEPNSHPLYLFPAHRHEQQPSRTRPRAKTRAPAASRRYPTTSVSIGTGERPGEGGSPARKSRRRRGHEIAMQTPCRDANLQYELQLIGGLQGMGRWTVYGLLGVGAMHHFWPLFRKQTWAIKAFLVTSCGPSRSASADCPSKYLRIVHWSR